MDREFCGTERGGPELGTSVALVPDQHGGVGAVGESAASRELPAQVSSHFVARGLWDVCRDRDGVGADEPEHTVRGVEGRSGYVVGDIPQAVWFSPGERAGDECLRGATATFQDHPTLDDLYADGKADSVARRGRGCEVLYPHSRRIAGRVGDPGAGRGRQALPFVAGSRGGGARRGADNCGNHGSAVRGRGGHRHGTARAGWGLRD